MYYGADTIKLQPSDVAGVVVEQLSEHVRKRIARCRPKMSCLSAHYGMADPEDVQARVVMLETAERFVAVRQRWLSFKWHAID